MHTKNLSNKIYENGRTKNNRKKRSCIETPVDGDDGKNGARKRRGEICARVQIHEMKIFRHHIAGVLFFYPLVDNYIEK